ncbi:MAG: DUF1844 domain-containing protein [Planctomycetota bacterium]|jgi:hypothetical protein|nr:DUF1844 domain-containing protein [Planctomycetota bacterium]
MAEEEKKIIIDEDWKKEAQKEKEVLAAQEDAEKKKEKAPRPRHGPLPKGNFPALVSMLVTQTLFALGLLEIEGQEKREPDLALAKYNIDMLETLQEKTKGNLTKEEEKLLENTINEIRMGYVKVAEGSNPH